MRWTCLAMWAASGKNFGAEPEACLLSLHLDSMNTQSSNSNSTNTASSRQNLDISLHQSRARMLEPILALGRWIEPTKNAAFKRDLFDNGKQKEDESIDRFESGQKEKAANFYSNHQQSPATMFCRNFGPCWADKITQVWQIFLWQHAANIFWTKGQRTTRAFGVN